MITYTTYMTKSGSVYDFDGKRIRRRVRSEISQSERVTAEWKDATVTYNGLNQPLTIIWGFGKDEHSENAIQLGDSEAGFVIRTTITTPVISFCQVTDSEETDDGI